MGSAIDNYNNYFNRAISFQSNITLLQSQYKSLKDLRDSKKEEMTNLIRELGTYEKSIELLKQLIENLSKGQIEHLGALINSALTTIFYDRLYTVDLVITEQRNTNNLQILLNEVLGDGTILQTKLEDNGYGVKSVIGFILQVYFIIYHKEYPILFLDEAFTNLSKQYLPYLKMLITSLSEKYNFIFVLVTHDRDLMSLSDRTYLVELGKVTLYNKEVGV